MYGRYIKFALVAALLGSSVYLFILGWIGLGILAIPVAFLVAVTLWQHERIIQAMWHMRKERIEKASGAIEKIKHPEALPKSQEAMVYYMRGILGAQSRSVGKTESLLKKALNVGLKNDQLKAMAKMNLAMISMQKRRKREALNYLNEAKKLDKGGVLNEQIKYIKQQMGRI